MRLSQAVFQNIKLKYTSIDCGHIKKLYMQLRIGIRHNFFKTQQLNGGICSLRERAIPFILPGRMKGPSSHVNSYPFTNQVNRNDSDNT